METNYLLNTNGTAEVPPTEVVHKTKRRRFSVSVR